MNHPILDPPLAEQAVEALKLANGDLDKAQRALESEASLETLESRHPVAVAFARFGIRQVLREAKSQWNFDIRRTLTPPPRLVLPQSKRERMSKPGPQARTNEQYQRVLACNRWLDFMLPDSHILLRNATYADVIKAAERQRAQADGLLLSARFLSALAVRVGDRDPATTKVTSDWTGDDIEKTAESVGYKLP